MGLSTMLALSKCGSAKDQLQAEAVSENAARAGATPIAGEVIVSARHRDANSDPLANSSCAATGEITSVNGRFFGEHGQGGSIWFSCSPT